MPGAADCRILVKPIRPAELMDAMCAVVNPGTQTTKAELITRHTIRDARNRLHVLLAKDNLVNQKLAARFLERRGYSVIVASNGREALAVIEKQSFDVVLMDIQMPEMDGFETAARIRKNEEKSGTHLPIIAMTAHAFKEDEQRCLSAGMDGYVTKPIRTSELFATIDRVMGSTRDLRDCPQGS
jgi:two-component system, sensor histidine kinase and response regulator